MPDIRSANQNGDEGKGMRKKGGQGHCISSVGERRWISPVLLGRSRKMWGRNAHDGKEKCEIETGRGGILGVWKVPDGGRSVGSFKKIVSKSETGSDRQSGGGGGMRGG